MWLGTWSVQVDRAWRAVSDAEKLGMWWPAQVVREPDRIAEGEEFAVFAAQVSYPWGPLPGAYVARVGIHEVEPPRKIVFRQGWPHKDDWWGSVILALRPAGKGCLLQVTMHASIGSFYGCSRREALSYGTVAMAAAVLLSTGKVLTSHLWPFSLLSPLRRLAKVAVG
jgi:uncharacterized protein YndB with AHSA1/START domain